MNIQEILKEFKVKIPLFLEEKDFVIKTASQPAEVMDALKLRHSVYYEEVLKIPAESGLDFDRYDSFCDHLLVIEKNTSKLAGTYRLNISPGNDFYSSKEFHIHNILKLPGKKMELGRACVHPDYRKGKTLQMLVKGFLTYGSMADIRYLFGCSSITTENRDDFLHIWKFLITHHRLPEHMDVEPVKKQEHVLNLYKELKYYDADYKKGRHLLNPLMYLYIKYGSLVSHMPFYDEDFKCFDFFTLMDMHQTDKKVVNRFKR